MRKTNERTDGETEGEGGGRTREGVKNRDV